MGAPLSPELEEQCPLPTHGFCPDTSPHSRGRRHWLRSRQGSRHFCPNPHPWRRAGSASLPSMAEPVPAGSDVSASTYQCTNCGSRLQTGSTKHLPPCPACHNGFWESITGGDSVDDPYPDK